MADPNDPREKRSAQEAASETEEPAEATRVRAEDDAETRARQSRAAAGLREADRALEDGGARLRETRNELRERGRELERTGDLTREVAQHAADLLAQTEQIVDRTRGAPRDPEPGPPKDPGSDQSR